MSYSTYAPILGNQLLEDIEAEIVHARTKHPKPTHLTVALLEEAGELAQAQLEQQGSARVRAEAIQVIAVAVRIIQEGDPDLLPEASSTLFSKYNKKQMLRAFDGVEFVVENTTRNDRGTWFYWGRKPDGETFRYAEHDVTICAYEDDFVRLDLKDMQTMVYTLPDLGLSWPCAALLEITIGDGDRRLFEIVSRSYITDAQRAEMTHVARGAEYREREYEGLDEAELADVRACLILTRGISQVESAWNQFFDTSLGMTEQP